MELENLNPQVSKSNMVPPSGDRGLKISIIHAGNFKLDGGAMFGVVPKSMWNKLNPADENNMCSWAMRCLLVDDGVNKVLIDTGMGDKQDQKFFSHYYLFGDKTLLGSLAEAGYKPEDITDVFHTHLHFDHCGGSVKRVGEGFGLTFPNAKCWVDSKHWDWGITPNAREKASFLKENLLPMLDLGALHFLPENEKSPWPWMEMFRCYGHTEAMILPIIDTGKGKLVFCADLFASAHHIPMPYVMGYDMRPLETLADKKRFFERAIPENWTLFFEHDFVNECARLEQSEKGVRVKETFAFVASGL
jgi:glyoxylase-like metal-dependent hydrolase (beta-lactamase superfamily II)